MKKKDSTSVFKDVFCGHHQQNCYTLLWYTVHNNVQFHTATSALSPSQQLYTLVLLGAYKLKLAGLNEDVFPKFTVVCAPKWFQPPGWMRFTVNENHSHSLWFMIALHLNFCLFCILPREAWHKRCFINVCRGQMHCQMLYRKKCTPTKQLLFVFNFFSQRLRAKPDVTAAGSWAEAGLPQGPCTTGEGFLKVWLVWAGGWEAKPPLYTLSSQCFSPAEIPYGEVTHTRKEMSQKNQFGVEKHGYKGSSSPLLPAQAAL